MTKGPLVVRNKTCLMPVPAKVQCLMPHCEDCGLEMQRIHPPNITIGQVYQCPHCKQEFVTLEEYPIFQLVRDTKEE